MLKFLLLGVILVAIYFIFFKKKRVVEDQSSQDSRWKDKREDQISNDLIPCEECGTLVPQSEAIISNGRYYCSEKCMRN